MLDKIVGLCNDKRFHFVVEQPVGFCWNFILFVQTAVHLHIFINIIIFIKWDSGVSLLTFQICYLVKFFE